MEDTKIGIIGGSGLYEMAELTGKEEVTVDTPFGQPSDNYITGMLSGRRVAFLSRHGRGHRLMPSELNYRANIYGFKKLGVEWLISASAVGSMKEDIRPMDIVFVDQFFDRTFRRIPTFFGQGAVAHIQLGDPVCGPLSGLLYETAEELNCRAHRGGTYLCIEGPQFSTRGESLIYRQWGVDVIGMTNATEAKLAREAEICYATMALVTDYDCWHIEEGEVSVAQIIAYLNRNAENARAIISRVVERIPETRDCPCATALKDAIITDRSLIHEDLRHKLGLFLDKYLTVKEGEN
jgi:5'-methylthioadenosine phosphorylase